MDLREQVLGLLGVLVVAYDEGSRLGKVSDIYVDRKACRITGIAISTGLSGNDSTSYVSFKHVRILGKDVVIVANQKAATPAPKGIDKTSLKLLKNVRIATRDGAFIGRLLDVSVDASNGNISQLMLSEREYLNIEVRSTAMGDDIIVLPSTVQKKTKKAPPKPQAKMKGTDSVTTMLESATKRFFKAARETTEKIFDTTKQAADRATPAMGQASGKSATAAKPVVGQASGKSATATSATKAPVRAAAASAAKTPARTTKKKRPHRAGLPKKR